MKKEDRESRIISLLEMKGEMTVDNLSKILDISPSTLRKQLADMQQRGLIIRTYGGIMSVNPVRDESFESKLKKNTGEKRRIAMKARTLIKDGASIALASGTSVYALCMLLDDMTSGTIYTNSMQAADYLSHFPFLEIHICGGIVRNHTGTIIGNDVKNYFKNLHLDYAFFGCDGIGEDGVIYSDNLAAASSERCILSSAKECYILCDSAKIGKKSVARIATLKECTAMITGKESANLVNGLAYMTDVIYA